MFSVLWKMHLPCTQETIVSDCIVRSLATIDFFGSRPKEAWGLLWAFNCWILCVYDFTLHFFSLRASCLAAGSVLTWCGRATLVVMECLRCITCATCASCSRGSAQDMIVEELLMNWTSMKYKYLFLCTNALGWRMWIVWFRCCQVSHSA